MIDRFLKTVLILSLVPAIVAAQEPEVTMVMAGNGEVAARLIAAGGQERITGRVSFDAIVAGDELRVRAFNLAFFGVPQHLLAEGTPFADPLGVLAFATVPGEMQPLQLDAAGQRVFGRLRITGDASFLLSLAQPIPDGDEDVFVTPSLEAVVDVDIRFESPGLRPMDETRTLVARGTLSARSTEGAFRAFRIEIAGQPSIRVDVGRAAIFDTERRLCIQPVRLLRSRTDRGVVTSQVSGAGLKFGRPGADLQWDKADVAFTYRDWVELPADKFWTLQENERSALAGQVEVDDCIEIFFVYEFKPAALWGGGVTLGAGNASAQIITSDENERLKKDLTHLAHELGHVLRLMHPNDFVDLPLVPGTPGTLMCPSDLGLDNPTLNSQENENFASNPLLTFSLKRRTSAPDCIDSSDCGDCP